MGFLKSMIAIFTVLIIVGLIIMLLWVFKAPNLKAPTVVFSEKFISFLMNVIIIFIMVVTVLITVIYSNQQIEGGRVSTAEQISAIKDATSLQLQKMGEQIELARTQIERGNEQTKLLKNQVFISNSLSVSQLGDRCMWSSPHGGEYNSYLILKTLEDEIDDVQIKNAVANQIKRVEDMYKSQDVMIDHVKIIQAIMKNDGTREWADEQTITAKNNLDHMYRWLWTERVKAAYFLSHITSEKLTKDNKKWGDVFEALMHTLGESEWSLFVRKISLITYADLTGNTSVPFKPLGVFDFKGAIKHWEEHRATILTEKQSETK